MKEGRKLLSEKERELIDEAIAEMNNNFVIYIITTGVSQTIAVQHYLVEKLGFPRKKADNVFVYIPTKVIRVWTNPEREQLRGIRPDSIFSLRG